MTSTIGVYDLQIKKQLYLFNNIHCKKKKRGVGIIAMLVNWTTGMSSAKEWRIQREVKGLQG